MKPFRKDSNYAVRTLVFIAQYGRNEPVSSTFVSESLGIPKNFLRRIFSKLIKAGFLEAKEGARGGVLLAKSPEEITVGQIVLLLQGGVKMCNCFHDREQCDEWESCILRERIMHVEGLILAEFEQMTIQSLMDDLAESPMLLDRQDGAHANGPPLRIVKDLHHNSKVRR